MRCIPTWSHRILQWLKDVLRVVTTKQGVKVSRARSTAQTGITVIELSIVMILILILAAVGVYGYQKMQQVFATGSGEQVVTAKLQLARQLAITLRRNIMFSLIGSRQIRIQSGTTLVEDAYLPGTVAYAIPTGAPLNPGNIAGLINLTNTSLVFRGDGSAVRPNGEPINGVVFLYDPTRADPSTASAVVLFGTTGRVKVFRYDGSNWQ